MNSEYNGFILVYMDIGPGSTDTGTIAFTFASTTSTVRQWEIKVTQIPCYSKSRYTITYRYSQIWLLCECITFFEKAN